MKFKIMLFTLIALAVVLTASIATAEPAGIKSVSTYSNVATADQALNVAPMSGVVKRDSAGAMLTQTKQLTSCSSCHAKPEIDVIGKETDNLSISNPSLNQHIKIPI